MRLKALPREPRLQSAPGHCREALRSTARSETAWLGPTVRRPHNWRSATRARTPARPAGKPPHLSAGGTLLQATLKFGLIFLGLQVAGTRAQRALGRYGFYAVRMAGGLISSASAVFCL